MSEEELSDESSNDLEESWIDWFCSLNANGLFCEIEKSFIEDNFNLYGLKLHFPANYNKALNTILDKGKSFMFVLNRHPVDDTIPFF